MARHNITELRWRNVTFFNYNLNRTFRRRYGQGRTIDFFYI